MACLLQPECNFLHGYFQMLETPGRSGRCGGKNYFHAGECISLEEISVELCS